MHTQPIWAVTELLVAKFDRAVIEENIVVELKKTDDIMIDNFGNVCINDKFVRIFLEPGENALQMMIEDFSEQIRLGTSAPRYNAKWIRENLMAIVDALGKKKTQDKLSLLVRNMPIGEKSENVALILKDLRKMKTGRKPPKPECKPWRNG